ncbi:efflux RND transporter periplasmic adaptor subunit [Candidatus Pacebacteria bacterium]|nr:efflux RND transporter periplasmic adaptor subunit [Candidatus Paceibacterota bacterium]
MKYFKFLKNKKILITIIVVAILIFSATSVFGNKGPDVEIDKKIKEVEVIKINNQNASSSLSIKSSGKVRAADAAELVSESSGVVKSVNVFIGDFVSRGQLLVSLSNADALAQVAQAKASLAVVEASMVSQETSLSNTKLAIKDSIEGAYIKIDDVLKLKITSLFSNPKTLSDFGIKITQGNTDYYIGGNRKSIVDSKAQESLRLLEKLELFIQNNDSYNTDEAYRLAEEALIGTRNLLDEMSVAISGYVATDSSVQPIYEGYKNSISASRTSINTTLTTLRSSKQSYDSASVASQDAALDQARAGLQSAEAQLSKTVVRAPFNGQILSVSAKIGGFASAGSPAVSIISTSEREIEMYLPSRDASFIKIGDQININNKYSGSVIKKAPGINSQTGKVEIIAVIEDKSDDLSTGEFVDVEIIPSYSNGELFVPLKAIRNTSGKSEVFYIEEGIIKSREVVVGSVQGELVKIESGALGLDSILANVRGLKAGDEVVEKQ